MSDSNSDFILAAVSLIFAGISAGSAWQATRAAKAARTASEDGELRAQKHQIALTAKDCSLALEEISRLEREMQSALRISQAARGIREDSGTQIMSSWVASKLRKAHEISEIVGAYLPGKPGLALPDAASAHDISVNLAATLKDLQSIRGEILEQIDKVNAGRVDAMRARSTTRN
ncbi:MAG: hypothetical protein Q8Q82_13870 [Hydrogenophaga sp.]|nr:hypothetical protein [Hydrogenophaga sp.]